MLFASASTRFITKEARKNAVTLGYMNEDDLVAVINQLRMNSFYKSMTSYSDYTIWQDVYRYQDDNDNHLYIKIQFSVDGENAILIQLKRDEGSEE